MPANPVGLVEFLGRTFRSATLHSVYEAGFSGFVLHRQLERNGIHNIVVHAGSVEVAVRDSAKCDRKDAKKLADLLAAGRLRSVRIPPEGQEQRRILSRTREQLVRARARIKNQVRMKLHQFGLIDIEDRRVLSLKYVDRLIKDALSPELHLALEALSEHWRFLDGQVLKVETALRQQALEDPLEAVYRAVPGIGVYAARVLANELGDMSQFANERALFSFVGLTPREFSSGEKRRLGHISRQGSGRIRGILIEAAWFAVRFDSALKEDFMRIAHRAGKKRAIVAIARKLIGRIRAALRQNVPYQLAYKKAA